jgi:hypothetical protein
MATTNCGICDREFEVDDEKPRTTVGGYAMTDELAKTLGVEAQGHSFVAICPKCHEKETGGRLN